ncbi:hypothetical protein [Nocardia miyunensis]|uniref:hypothetical protein n=1 Tax=Nocardia miyunensis TaxID=282684 RepID=UPI000AE02D72|nr:hypothetical protein [Nocardia miyunensis]
MTSRKGRHKKRQSEISYHRVVVRGSRHDPPDARKLAAVIVSLAESFASIDDEMNSTTPDETIISIDDDPPEGHLKVA